MAAQSRMIELGAPAPDFALPDPSGQIWSLDKIASGKPVLVAFIRNHCPYVVHIADAFAAFAREYQPKGLAVVAISANDVTTHPQDAPDKRALFAQEHGFSFPYLYDESQNAARAYGAVCTPDLFLFDARHKLAYRGQFDATRPNRGAPTGADIRAAADALLAGRAPNPDQTPSVGCGIPGAYTPVCTHKHLPPFVQSFDRLKQSGFSQIVCIAASDPFTLNAWSRTIDPERKIRFVSDGNLEFTRRACLVSHESSLFLGERSKRYAMTLENAIITRLSIEGSVLDVACSGADVFFAA